MKRLVLGTAGSLVLGAVAVLMVPSAALATITPGAVTLFRVAYEITPGTTWSCQGTHVVNNVQSSKDLELCLVKGDTTGYVAGTYRSDPTNPGYGNTPGIGYHPWNSDYWYSVNSSLVLASSWTITEIDLGKGIWIATVVASFPS
jgi:hypothetical protein